MPAPSPRRPRSTAGEVSEAATAAGPVVELEVQRVAHGGVFVAREDGDERVVFVPDTAPGERVLARITDVRDRFARAETLEVLRASPDRVPHVWASAGVDRVPEHRAGGAEFGHLAPEAQRRLKTEVLRDALLRTGGLPADLVADLGIEVRAAPGAADGTGSRTRLRVHADGRGGAGPFAARTHRVVPVPDLPLAVAALAPLLATVRRHDAGAVDLVAAEGTAIALPHGAPPVTVQQTVAGRRFAVNAGGFWQVHPAAPAELTDAVRSAVRPVLDPAAANLDLYGGVGLLAAALVAEGGAATRVTTVESDRAASAHAGGNLADAAGARAVHAPVERFLAAEHGSADGAVVVLDPPRSGAGRAVVERIAALAPRRIVYVACDPVALARDAGTLLRLGWAPVSVDAIDLFPATHHIEAVAVFDRG